MFSDSQDVALIFYLILSSRILELEASLIHSRMDSRACQAFITLPMGIAEDVVWCNPTHSDDPSPSSSPVKTSDNFEKFADELAPLDSLPPGNDDSTLKKDLHEENFQELSRLKNSNFPIRSLFNTPLSTRMDCLLPEDRMNLQFNFFSNGMDPFTIEVRRCVEPLTLPARNDREFEEYLSLMTVLNEISTSQGNVHQNSVIESLPIYTLMSQLSPSRMMTSSFDPGHRHILELGGQFSINCCFVLSIALPSNEFRDSSRCLRLGNQKSMPLFVWICQSCSNQSKRTPLRERNDDQKLKGNPKPKPVEIMLSFTVIMR
ncbi:hypothetical protein Tco_0878567 [Tanacetum coccineum]|uniref:Uncharacterized protein n=1 Tax=Tanacetum coccineum TaxID=301880 RepID=A0ABQ5C1P6_9ASTR